MWKWIKSKIKSNPEKWQIEAEKGFHSRYKLYRKYEPESDKYRYAIVTGPFFDIAGVSKWYDLEADARLAFSKLKQEYMETRRLNFLRREKSGFME